MSSAQQSTKKKRAARRKPLKSAAQIAGKRSKKTALGYPAVDDTTRRRHTSKEPRSELAILPQKKRLKANATVRDDRRAFTILAWMVRRHLDCVSRFTPHVRTRDDDVNKILRTLIRWHGSARNFDALGRHGRDEWMRMFEGCKVLGGDAGGLKVQGMKLQGIEGDRICKPKSVDSKVAQEEKERIEKVSGEGLLLAEDGTVDSYCVCKRGEAGKGLDYERLVPADEMIFDAYWPERFDSNRGVSPLLTALNEGADVRETWEWLVLKAKASAVFGLAFTRTGSDEIAPTQGDPETAPPESESAAYSTQVQAAMKARGLINVDLDPGDKVEEIESKTPNPTVIKFTRELIRSFLLALDIPFTFYDSLTASFSARIADRNEYEESCEWKREKNQSVLDKIYGEWLLPAWAKADLFGFGNALQKAELTIEEVAAFLRWVPAGRPWLDRANEMSGHILALAAGVTSTPRIAASYGDDAYEIADEQKHYLENAGIPLLYGQGGQVAVQNILGAVGKPKAEEPSTVEDDNEQEQ